MILNVIKWIVYIFGLVYAVGFLIDVIDSHELGPIVSICIVITAFLAFGVHKGAGVIGLSGFIYYMTKQ